MKLIDVENLPSEGLHPRVKVCENLVFILLISSLSLSVSYSSYFIYKHAHRIERQQDTSHSTSDDLVVNKNYHYNSVITRVSNSPVNLLFFFVFWLMQRNFKTECKCFRSNLHILKLLIIVLLKIWLKTDRVKRHALILCQQTAKTARTRNGFGNEP